MVVIDTLKTEVSRIIRANIPAIQLLRIDITEGADSDGQQSIWINAIIKTRPLEPREMARKSSMVVDQLRTWMTSYDDERFPYFDFLTEQDEQELQQAGE